MDMNDLGSVPIKAFRRMVYGAQCLAQQAVDPVDAVARAGYVRTLGGVDVYLAIRARVSGLTRGSVDQLVQRGRLRVVPTVRGCIYLVPEDEVGLSLRMADALSKRRREREYAKVQVGAGELHDVGGAILTCLSNHGATTTTALRRLLPEGTVRSLGDVGKKVGISSTLPPALRELEFQGRIERRPVDGRLDSEQYEWVVGNPLPPAPSVEVVHDHMARRFFGAAGLAPLDQLAEWSGLGKRDARSAAERIGVTDVAVEGSEGYCCLQGASPVETVGVAFLPFQDNLIQLQGGPQALVAPAHWDVPVPTWGRGKGDTLGTVKHMAYRTIMLDGELVGFWEFDPVSNAVVTFCFASGAAKAEAAIKAEADAVAGFILEDLGHGRSFSIDTEKDLARRAGEIERMAQSL